MTNKELQIIADAFGLPCEFICDEVTEHYNEWCEKNCGRVGNDQCLRKYINIKLNKEKLDDTADIIRRWERYCACGEKMMPNTAGGWYCPVCHRTMKSILFKRVK